MLTARPRFKEAIEKVGVKKTNLPFLASLMLA